MRTFRLHLPFLVERKRKEFVDSVKRKKVAKVVCFWFLLQKKRIQKSEHTTTQAGSGRFNPKGMSDRRGSSMFTSLGGPQSLLANTNDMADYDDSDYEDEEGDTPKPAAAAPKPAAASSGAPAASSNPSAPGGRPMVGGFAAAAYEAAKAHHYAQLQAKKKAQEQKSAKKSSSSSGGK